MTRSTLVILIFVGTLISCSKTEDRYSEIVVINDPKIEEDICAAVYYYAKTVIELGRGEFVINNHLWRSFSPIIPDNYDLVKQFTPEDYDNIEDLKKLVGNRSETKLIVHLRDHEPALKLFLILDYVQSVDQSCWIETSETSESIVKVFAPSM